MGRTPPRNVVAVTPGGDLTLDHILGWYAVSSIPDAGVSLRKIRRAWIAQGLDPDLIPKDRKAVHAFQSACRSVETRRNVAESDGDTDDRKVEIRVDEVLNDSTECVYQITQQVRDKANKVIEHPKGMRITFTKSNGQIDKAPLENVAYEQVKHLADSIQEHFDANATKLPGAKVRAAIRGVLKGLNATTIAGKMYFIPKAGRATIEELQEVLKEVYGSNPDAEFHTIPVASDEGQKELIAKHLKMNVSAEVTHLLADVSERLKSGTGVRSDRLKNMVNDKRRLNTLVEGYKDMLDMSLGEIEEKVTLLNEGLEELIVSSGSASVTAD